MTQDTDQRTILIADDDAPFTSALSTRLSKQGYKVVVAHDGYMALDAALKNKPDLLILDINMPAGNGFSVLERLRNREDNAVSQTPLIIISGENTPNLRATAHRYGAFTFLGKPFESALLVKSVRQALGEERIDIAAA